MKWNVICNAEDRFSCLELFLRAKNTNAVRAKTHAVFSATKQMKRIQGTHAEKVLLSERKVLNAILRVQLKYMKNVSFSWNEMLFAMQKTDFHVLELFCRASHVRASMHRITSLELLKTLMMCLVQLSKWRECKAKDAEKLLSQWEKVAKCNLRVTLKYMKDVSFSWNEMLFAMQKTDFQLFSFFKS